MEGKGTSLIIFGKGSRSLGEVWLDDVNDAVQHAERMHRGERQVDLGTRVHVGSGLVQRIVAVLRLVQVDSNICRYS